MPAQLALTPATNCGTAAGSHTTHEDGAGTTGTDAAEEELFRQAVADATRGPSVASIGGWVVAGLMLLGGLFYYFRGRHRAEEDDEPEDDDPTQNDVQDGAAETDEPVAAGKWSLRG
jgi:hypothetical protein